jgi:hypothetical protein
MSKYRLMENHGSYWEIATNFMSLEDLLDFIEKTRPVLNKRVKESGFETYLTLCHYTGGVLSKIEK